MWHALKHGYLLDFATARPYPRRESSILTARTDRRVPIYDQHYHPWPGCPRPRWLRWTVITRYHLRGLFESKGRNGLILLLLIAGVIQLVFLMMIYLSANKSILDTYGISASQLVPIDNRFFLYPIMYESLIIGFLTLIVGSGLIADDRRDNAIPLYLSKPLTPLEYLLGKFGVVAFFVLAITAVPVNFLFVFEVLTDGGWAFLKKYWWLPFSITSLSLAVTAVCGSIILLASSLVKKGAIAAVIVIGLFVGHNVMVGVIESSLGVSRLKILSIQFNLHGLGLWLFGVRDAPELQFYGFSGPQAALVLLALVAVCWVVLWWRVRPEPIPWNRSDDCRKSKPVSVS